MKYFQEYEKNFAGPVTGQEMEAAISDFHKKLVFVLFFLFFLNMFIGNS